MEISNEIISEILDLSDVNKKVEIHGGFSWVHEYEKRLDYINKLIKKIKQTENKKIKVYATHQTAIIWYLIPPNTTSYYMKEINENMLTDGIYVQKKQIYE